MRYWLLLLLAGCAASGADDVATERAGPFSAGAYSSCAACHLPDGAGLPGAFPPLKDRVAQIASVDGGREYLIMVASFGLMGTIEIGGTQYFGVMPGNKGAMSDADIAAAINYAIFELSVDASGIKPVSAEEVAAVQAGTADKSMAAAGKSRAALVEAAGEKWPN